MKIKATYIKTFSTVLQQLIRGESLLINNLYGDDSLFDETDLAIRESLFYLEFLGYPSEILETLYNYDRFEQLMEELNKTSRVRKIPSADNQTFCDLFARNLRLLRRISLIVEGLYPEKRAEFKRGTAYALSEGASMIDKVFVDNGGVLFSPSGETTLVAMTEALERAPEIIANANQRGASTRQKIDGSLFEGVSPIIASMLLAQEMFGGRSPFGHPGLFAECPGCPNCAPATA